MRKPAIGPSRAIRSAQYSSLARRTASQSRVTKALRSRVITSPLCMAAPRADERRRRRAHVLRADDGGDDRGGIRAGPRDGVDVVLRDAADGDDREVREGAADLGDALGTDGIAGVELRRGAVDRADAEVR